MNLKKLMLSSLLVLATSLQAQDRIGWDMGSNPAPNPGQGSSRDQRDQPRDQPRDPWENNQSSIKDVELQLNQYYLNHPRLNLLQDSYTRSQLQGKRIKEITIIASSEAGNGQARLLLNGVAIEQAKTVARQTARYTFRVDSSADSINQNLRTLELELKGRFYVEKVIFGLIQNNGPVNPGPWPPSQPKIEIIRQQLNENIRDEGGLQLNRLFNLEERQGQALKRITVLARSQRGSANAQLLINDRNTGLSQNIGLNSTRITFEVNGQRLGREIQNIRLYFRGTMVIEEVSLELESGSIIPTPGPIQERRIEQIINQRLYETNGISLNALMRLDRRHDDRIVESVELVLRNSDYGAKVKLCQQTLGAYQSQNCANVLTLNPGSQIARLAVPGYSKLSELSLSVRMGMIDIDRIIINLR